MDFPLRSLSQIGKGIRTRARRKEITYFEASRRILFQEESPDHAIEVALENYEETRQPELLALLGDLYVVAGEQVVAESIFRSMYAQGQKPHITNLIYAGIEATVALVDDSKKMLFVPIPKCGSSTVKNYFTMALHGKYFGETVHFQYPELYRIVTREDLATTYKDYHRFSVVRDPISRLVSYFMHNVAQGSLAKEAFGCRTFMDYATRPGPNQARKDFHVYRQFFKDFRHHTDPACGFLDPVRSELDAVYQMSDLDDLRARMSKTYKCELGDERAMVSAAKDAEFKEKCKTAFAPLADFYSADYANYM